MSTLTWRGLEFAATKDLENHFSCGHWAVWKPKKMWTASWVDANTYAVALATTDDPIGALEGVLEQLSGCLARERARLTDLGKTIVSLQATCMALALDLDSLGVPRSL
jgi:hypothetical protein